MNTSTQPLTLNDVKQQFDDWRSNRGKVGSFPEAHWRAAVGLLDHYNPSEIIRELRITKGQLEDRKQRYQRTETVTHPFVSVELPNNTATKSSDKANVTQPPIPATMPASSIELRKPDGTTLIIHELPGIEVQSLVTTFMG